MAGAPPRLQPAARSSSPPARPATARCGRAGSGKVPADPPLGTVAADGAGDPRRGHTALVEQGATAIVPIRTNGPAGTEACPAAPARTKTSRATRRFGRAVRTRLTGSHAPSRIQPRSLGLTSLGDRISAREPNRQTAELPVRIAPMTRSSSPGTAEIVPKARTSEERQKLSLSRNRATRPQRPSPVANPSPGSERP
jgi:hypothetical protein